MLRQFTVTNLCRSFWFRQPPRRAANAIKVESRKNTPASPEFFLLRSPLDGAGTVLTARTRCSVAGQYRPAVGFSLPAVFIASSQRSLSVPKSTKQNVVKIGDHSSIRDSWPIAFSGCREGLGSAVRLGARSTQRLTSQLRLALEPECLENRTATTREDPRDGADSIRDTPSCLWFQIFGVEAHPFFHTINTIVAIFSPGSGVHLRSHAFGTKADVELLERTRFDEAMVAALLNRFFRS